MKKLLSFGLLLFVIITLSSCTNNVTPSIDCSIDSDNQVCLDICPEGTKLENGMCKIIKEEITCKDDEFLVDGTCEKKELICDNGYHEENGACEKDPLVCDEGYHIEDDTCIEDEVVCVETPTHPDCEGLIFSCEEVGATSCNYGIAYALQDGTYDIFNTYNSLEDATTIYNENPNDNVVLVNRNEDVIKMKNGIINFKTKSSFSTTTLLHVGFSEPTYINGHYNVDGIYLSHDETYTTGMIAGVMFKVKNIDIELIPYNHALESYSYYKNVNGELVHYITKDIKTKAHISMGAIDIAPEYLDEGVKYYSYDNHYFYTSPILLANDARSNSHINAVNANNPYYNYYQNLSFRSKTNYTAEELNSYINSKVTTSSGIYNTGQDFINAQETVYINAAMELSLGIHESGWGNSSIAQDKNNLFGINAVDSDPYNQATTFATVEDCIKYHVGYLFSERYFNPTHWVSYGTNLGNKYQGINYKYASDAYWGEKIAKHYYNLDKALGFKDHNSNKIAILDTEALGYLDASVDSKVIYDSSKYSYYGLEVPFTIVNEMEEFYVLQLPLGLNENNVMDKFEVMTDNDVFYVLKTSVTIVNE